MINRFLASALLGLCSLPAAAQVIQGGITLTPATPVAWEAFTVTIVTGMNDQGTLRALDIDGSNILIRHQTDQADYIMQPMGQRSFKLPGLPSGNYTIVNEELNADGNLSAEVGQPFIESRHAFSVGSAPATLQVHAFYSPLSPSTVGRYFLTASAKSSELILRDPEGEMRIYQENKADIYHVDSGFKAWPADGPAPAAAVPVCRFYASTVNSWFYTADAAECEFLQQEDHGWHYEGIAFRALPAIGGSCPPGSTEVWRLYNSRFAEQASNHRFTTSSGVYQSLIAEGWVGEGVVFCAPH